VTITIVVTPTTTGRQTALALISATGDDARPDNNVRTVVIDTVPVVPLTRRLLTRHQQAEQRQLNLYVRRLSALLRAHQLLERRLLVARPFTAPPPAAPIPTPFPF
jgi:hypothetical protein